MIKAINIWIGDLNKHKIWPMFIASTSIAGLSKAISYLALFTFANKFMYRILTAEEMQYLQLFVMMYFLNHVAMWYYHEFVGKKVLK